MTRDGKNSLVCTCSNGCGRWTDQHKEKDCPFNLVNAKKKKRQKKMMLMAGLLIMDLVESGFSAIAYS